MINYNSIHPTNILFIPKIYLQTILTTIYFIPYFFTTIPHYINYKLALLLYLLPNISSVTTLPLHHLYDPLTERSLSLAASARTLRHSNLHISIACISLGVAKARRF